MSNNALVPGRTLSSALKDDIPSEKIVTWRDRQYLRRDDAMKFLRRSKRALQRLAESGDLQVATIPAKGRRPEPIYEVNSLKKVKAELSQRDEARVGAAVTLKRSSKEVAVATELANQFGQMVDLVLNTITGWEERRAAEFGAVVKTLQAQIQQRVEEAEERQLLVYSMKDLRKRGLTRTIVRQLIDAGQLRNVSQSGAPRFSRFEVEKALGAEGLIHGGVASERLRGALGPQGTAVRSHGSLRG